MDTARLDPDYTGIGPLLRSAPTSPGAKRARAALPLAVRRKLEALEQDAEVAHGRLRVLSDRERAARDEQQRITLRLDALRANPTHQTGSWVPSPIDGPRARVWVPAPDDDPAALERDLLQVTADVDRLSLERSTAETRWTALGQLVARCCTHLRVSAA